MKIFTITAFFLIVFAGSVFAQTAPREINDAKYYEMAETFVKQLKNSRYEEACKSFDETISSSIDRTRLQIIWEKLLVQIGRFEKIDDRSIFETPQAITVVLTGEFEKMFFDIRISFNEKDEISGLYFVPNRDKDLYVSPDYVDESKFDEIELTIGDAPWALPATLAVPKGEGAFPAIVLVHGSGPNDRDESVGPNKPFRDIAQGLASRGIAVLRYEKRTKQYPNSISRIDDFTPREETVIDAAKAVETLADYDKINPNRIFVFGHSLGGFLIPRIAREQSRAAGYIMAAANASPLEKIFLDQIEYISLADGKISPEEQAQIDLVKSKIDNLSRLTDSSDYSAIDLPLNLKPAYWMYLKNYDPVAEAANIDRPTLIIGCGRDYQVTREEFKIWESVLGGDKNFHFKYFPELNHLFASGKDMSVPAEYTEKKPVSRDFVEYLAKWIKASD